MAQDKYGVYVLIGRECYWYDPELGKREETYKVIDIKGEDEDAVVLIANDHSEVEVYANEIEII